MYTNLPPFQFKTHSGKIVCVGIIQSEFRGEQRGKHCTVFMFASHGYTLPLFQSMKGVHMFQEHNVHKV